MTEVEVDREAGQTVVACRACVVECESVGATTVAALMGLPCDLFRIDETADAEEGRDD